MDGYSKLINGLRALLVVLLCADVLSFMTLPPPPPPPPPLPPPPPPPPPGVSAVVLFIIKLGRFSNRTGTSVDDWKARGKD